MNYMRLAIEALNRAEYWRKVERMYVGSWFFGAMKDAQLQNKRYVRIARYCLEKSDNLK